MYLLLLVKVRNLPMDNVLNFVNKGWHLFYDSEAWGTSQSNWLGQTTPSYSPYDVPLWFLRDLIVVSLLSPLIHLYVRKLKIYGIALLFIAYISKIWILLPGFSISAFFFFTLGAYFAINRINIISFVYHYKVSLMIVALLSFLLVCWTNGNATTIGRSSVAVFSTVGVFVAFYISAELIMRYDLRPNKLLVSSCFFVYAMHTIGEILCPLWLSKLMIHFVIPGQTELENCICYIVSPFITAAMCIATYALCVKLSPKVASVLSGG
jgi:membrane-bound acyltransferase YfiQ involved in biofilm formation